MGTGPLQCRKADDLGNGCYRDVRFSIYVTPRTNGIQVNGAAFATCEGYSEFTIQDGDLLHVLNR